jgi:hypothetical protein
MLVKGHKGCVFEETSGKQREEGEMQVGICALLPESERKHVLAAIKEEGATYRSWKD